MTVRFGERVRSALGAQGPLCVGVDPHGALLDAWNLPRSAAGVREFGLRTVDAAAGRVGVIKPQVSFFECFGSAGMASLEDVMRAGREAGLIVIADAKRGDIGTTMDAYAEAWLAPGSPFEADALTVNPYLGVGALTGAFAAAEAHGKGVFVLAATSNPEAPTLQTAKTATGETVSASVMTTVSAFNASHTPAGEWGSLGFVIGATVDADAAGITSANPPAPILAPGFGAQGAGPADLVARFGATAPTVIASESRSILSAGPDGLAVAIDTRIRTYREILDA
ncbi:orotidine-5'-phosphate decarboxylase [uncultured Microbacterium sp.]|uniref:orotidine-5'-phosphate decarboxylase n=1 Tax=uncultured Microbacterium sp. TaxID=191216 RepID=UPI002628D5A5|nr:orotidine-5'-phosphate decarboxylase [uncultured Microbacterium sp.]